MPPEVDNADTDEPPTRAPWLKPNTVGGTLIVASVLCFVCSLLVSGTAVALRDIIRANKELIRHRNVLIAAGLYDASKHTDADVPRLFEQVETVMVQLPTRVTNGPTTGEDVNPGQIIPMPEGPRSAEDEKLVSIPPELDLGSIKNRPPRVPVYVIKREDGSPRQFVLPVYGKGLWSTLYGYLALVAEVEEGLPVNGITFYEHAETPGLGGEVDNPRWKAQWPDKKLFNADWQPVLDVTKPDNADEPNEVDGISGATVTSNGVENLVNYWLGPDGFGPFLERYRSGELDFTAQTPRRGESAEEGNNR